MRLLWIRPYLPIVLVVACALSASMLTAQLRPRPASPKDMALILAEWGQEFEKVKAFLEDGKEKKAYWGATNLLRKMTDQILGGPDVGRLLATVTVYRAVAAVELGREEEGLWHWHVAHEMFPRLDEEYDFSTLGPAAAFLERSSSRTESPVGSKQSSDPGMEAQAIPAEEVSPPRRKRTPRPSLPAAKRNSKPVAVIVQVTIGKDGVPRHPTIIESQGELTLIFAVLDQLREWEFEPATHKGKAVAVYYNLTVCFGGGC